MRLRLGVGWLLFVFAWQAGCGKPEAVSNTDVANEIVDIGPQFMPLPASPKLAKLESGEFVWGDETSNDSRLVKVLFDNGTNTDVTIELAADVTFKVPAAGQVKLLTHVGEVSFRASDAGYSEPETIKLMAEVGDSLIYNHRSFWDYTWNYGEYATQQIFFGGNDRSTHFAGPVFFKTGRIDFLFEALPQSVQTMTFGGGFATDAKTSLNHSRDEETKRTVQRIVTRQGAVLHVVSDGTNAVTVHRLGDSIEDGQLAVYVDHAAVTKDSAPLAVRLSEQAIAEVPADEVLHLYLPLRIESLVADFGGGGTESLDVSAEKAGRFIWCPNGRRLYEVEYRNYTASDFGFGFGGKVPDPTSCRGLRFFRCRVPIIFQAFPRQYSLPAEQHQATVGRLVKHESGNFPEAIELALLQLLAQAKGQMSPEKYSSLATALPASKRLSDCDLKLAEAWVALENREFTTTVSLCDDVLLFQPDRALAFKLRGLARADSSEGDAASDLLRALELDPNLESELRPRVDQIQSQQDNSK